jgi:hypothetical protein
MPRFRVVVDPSIRQCEVCQNTRLQKTFHVKDKETGENYHIGRVCIFEQTGIDTSGNPYRAAERIEEYINAQEDFEFDMYGN